jgi:hypothetical protein
MTNFMWVYINMQFGDWLLLYMLSANMEPMVWGELVLELQQMLKDQERQELPLTYLNNQGNTLRTDRRPA